MVSRTALASWLLALALAPATAAAQSSPELPSADAGLAELAVFAVLFYVVYVALSLVVGVVVLSVSEFVCSESYVRAVEARIRDSPGRAGAIGVGVMIAASVGYVLLLIVLLVLVAVGLPEPVSLLAAVPLFAGTVFLYVGSTVGTVVFGSSLLGRVGREEPNLWLALVVGALIVNVPVLNFVLAFVVLFVGTGGMLDQWWSGRGGGRGPETSGREA